MKTVGHAAKGVIMSHDKALIPDFSPCTVAHKLNIFRAKATLPGHADEVYALDWSPDGSAVASGSKDRTIKIWAH